MLDISKSTDPRLAEVQKLLAHIKRLEALATTGHDTVSGDTAAILRGLFFVQLYGVLEYAVSLSVQVLLQEITKLAISYSHFEHLIFAIALDAEFKSIVDAGWDSKLQKRRLLLERQASGTSCSLNDTVFHDQLQNIWFATLDTIFEYLCIPTDPVPETRMRGYVNEIVTHRNEIAHGRSSASAVGRLKSSTDLDERLKAVTQIIDHVIISFDDYLTKREFVAVPHRALYLAAGAAPVAQGP
jgi:HEPN superfamily protein